jgi:hypothetical protein
MKINNKTTDKTIPDNPKNNITLIRPLVLLQGGAWKITNGS